MLCFEQQNNDKTKILPLFIATINNNNCVFFQDVVKNHLTHAVRLEVQELKVKINELVERISFLEYENDMLRSNVTPEVLANLGNKDN